MILVDTSIWIDFFRGKNRTLAEAVCALLDDDAVALAAPVRLELLSGAGKDQKTLTRVLAALPYLCPTTSTWSQAEAWALSGAARGFHFGASDLLIAALAAEHNAALWSADSDFQHMAKLGFITLHEPSK